MEKMDFRKLGIDTRNEIRRLAIQQINKGVKKKEVAKLYGVDPNTVSDWVKLYKSLGMKGLKEKKRGVDSESKKHLNPENEKKVQSMILDTMPDQLKLPFGLWTRKAVIELIEREFGITLALTTMGGYLRSWGYTPQKPKKKAYEQNPQKVKQWLETEYPEIKKKAKEEGAEIHWGDETGARNINQHGRSYAPKGKTPVKMNQAKRFSVNMISSVTNTGKVAFMIYSGTMNSERFKEFCKQLIKGRSKKVFLIVDNLRVHHSKDVSSWINENKESIELFFLPAYSPEKNPDEYLNCDLKYGLSEAPPPRDEKQLRNNIEKHMEILSTDKERVRKYFKHKDINYAA